MKASHSSEFVSKGTDHKQTTVVSGIKKYCVGAGNIAQTTLSMLKAGPDNGARTVLTIFYLPTYTPAFDKVTTPTRQCHTVNSKQRYISLPAFAMFSASPTNVAKLNIAQTTLTTFIVSIDNCIANISTESLLVLIWRRS